MGDTARQDCRVGPPLSQSLALVTLYSLIFLLHLDISDFVYSNVQCGSGVRLCRSMFAPGLSGLLQAPFIPGCAVALLVVPAFVSGFPRETLGRLTATPPHTPQPNATCSQAACHINVTIQMAFIGAMALGHSRAWTVGPRRHPCPLWACPTCECGLLRRKKKTSTSAR